MDLELEKNSWKTANKQDVKNKDLWNELDQLNSEKKYSGIQ